MDPDLRDAVEYIRNFNSPRSALLVRTATLPQRHYLANTSNLATVQLPRLLRALYLQVHNGDGFSDLRKLFDAAWTGNLPSLGGMMRDVDSLTNPVRVITPCLTIDVMQLMPSHLLQILAAPAGICEEVIRMAGKSDVSPATIRHTRVQQQLRVEAYMLESFCWCEIDQTLSPEASS